MVKQKIGKHIYIYEAEGVWDPEKKQSRQKRKYIGKLDPDSGEIITPRKSVYPRSVRDFGAVYLLKALADNYGLTSILNDVLGGEAPDLFNMAAFQLCEGKPFYLMKSWLEGTHIDSMSVADSQDISRFFTDLGQRDSDRRRCIERWSLGQPASKAVAFDITSLSSHGKLIDLLEWGYNRDGESLPQINLGIVMRIPDGIPLSYHIYPGSITDVTTLSNIVTELKAQRISIRRFVLDRGFYSIGNIRELSQARIPFIMPMPFRSHLAGQLLSDSKAALQSPMNAFVHEKQTMFHTSFPVDLGSYSCQAHVYLDEERKARETNRLIHRLTELERVVARQKCPTMDEALEIIRDKGQGLDKLFTVTMENGQAVLKRKPKKLSAMMNRYGKIILVAKANNLNREELIHLYRRRDMIEKLFDVLKNEFDSNRIRIHSRDALEGRLFVMFLSMILYFIIQTRIHESDLLKSYSVSEILSKLKILRSVQMSNGKSHLTEITKKQRDIYEAFQVPLPKDPCY
ncbi:IS1634 family transposase [bacterium]|nr:IS1634 family transposase [candidate division CSSED10-310 bacterium]